MVRLQADDTKPPMTRIEFRRISPNILPNSFGAKPTILYVAGPTYSRIEQQPNPEKSIHQLIVCTEPDIWMINLFNRTGRHLVDPGPTFIAHHNILDREPLQEFSTFEYGKEVEFFRVHNPTTLDVHSLDGQPCNVTEVTISNYRAVLFVRSDTLVPFHLDVFKNGMPFLSVRYLDYQTNLPFVPALFAPPTDIEISEPQEKNAK